MVKKEYQECRLCPNMCRVDRSKSFGVCHQSDKVKIAWAGLHRGEEPPITGRYGSGMIFFTGCPLHCAYCQNIQISGADMKVELLNDGPVTICMDTHNKE